MKKILQFRVAALSLIICILTTPVFAQDIDRSLNSPAQTNTIQESQEHPHPDDVFEEGLSLLDRVAVFVTDHVGTFGFFLIIMFWTLLWLLWNTFAPPHWKFDPFPSFALWLFISNVIQLTLLPLLMVGQNISDMRFKAKIDVDHHIMINLSDKMDKIYEKLDQIDDQIKRIQN
ncbi:MAG: DUF1003 domain-containing protein [Chlamydiales bacterium]|nr:DUF1003 domain-containing protein [Chlamydiales bacterium]